MATDPEQKVSQIPEKHVRWGPLPNPETGEMEIIIDINIEEILRDDKFWGEQFRGNVENVAILFTSEGKSNKTLKDLMDTSFRRINSVVNGYIKQILEFSYTHIEDPLTRTGGGQKGYVEMLTTSAGLESLNTYSKLLYLSRITIKIAEVKSDHDPTFEYLAFGFKIELKSIANLFPGMRTDLSELIDASFLSEVDSYMTKMGLGKIIKTGSNLIKSRKIYALQIYTKRTDKFINTFSGTYRSATIPQGLQSKMGQNATEYLLKVFGSLDEH